MLIKGTGTRDWNGPKVLWLDIKSKISTVPIFISESKLSPIRIRKETCRAAKDAEALLKCFSDANLHSFNKVFKDLSLKRYPPT